MSDENLNGPVTAPVTSFDDPRSRTRVEFCNIEHFSLSSFFALRKRGLAPDEISPPGTNIHRITAQAHAAWRSRMTELAKTEAAELAANRRRRQAQAAGEEAAKSPTHISKKNIAKAQARRRAAEASE
jgi:hypothetical protein